MTTRLEEQLAQIKAAPPPAIAGFENQRAMMLDLYKLGLLAVPEPPVVSDARPPTGPVRVRWRAT